MTWVGPVATLLVVILVPSAMLFVVPRNRSPTSAIAWLLVIAVLPVLGLLIYLIIGSPKLPRRRRAQQAEFDAFVRRRVAEARDQDASHLLHPSLDPLAKDASRLVERLGGLPPVMGNAAEVITDYNAALRRIAEDIGRATAFVHVEYYILALDESTEPVFRALEAAQRRGVKVRVLFDHIGSRTYARHREMLDRLSRANIEWSRMLPFQPLRREWARPDLRNHRKIVVVDGNVAWAGSQNLIDQHYSEGNRRRKRTYAELVVRLQGPIVVELDTIFRSDWITETEHPLEELAVLPSSAGSVTAQVLPSGPAHPYENNLRLFNLLAYGAQREIVLTNPYFVPDESLLLALTTAAQRGVEVTLITDRSGDHPLLRFAQESFYTSLMAAGVKVLLHRGPTILHSKTVTIDSSLAVIGSSNLDMRSFHLNLEVTNLFYGGEVVEQVRRAERFYRSRCEELDLAAWRRRSTGRKFLNGIARLTAALQ